MSYDDLQKYPPSIQRLFAPKLPVPFFAADDYAPEARRTATVAPVSAWKSQYEQHAQQIRAETADQPPSELVANYKNAQARKRAVQASFQRQLHDWNTGEISPEFKDPYKTVFVGRLAYTLTELELSKHLSKYGEIESVKIARDTSTRKSKGYGFVVFMRDVDAKTCVKDLGASGLKIPENGARTILVDIERGRIVRNWKPRRLGGGLGGRHYTKTGISASAAASGRRNNLASNPYQDRRPPKSHYRPDHYPKSEEGAYGSYKSEKKDDKYAKYSATPYKSQSSSSRSIRAIRQRD